MKLDSALSEGMLRQAEGQLEALEEEKRRLIRVIAGAQRELKLLASQRNKCVKAISSFKDMLGLPLSPEEAELCGISNQEDLEISNDCFSEMTLVDAAKTFLTMLNRPATHREMFEGLRKGGVNQDLKHLENSLRSAMSRRPETFVFLKEDGRFGVWQLAEWIEGTSEHPVIPPKPEPLRIAASAGG